MTQRALPDSETSMFCSPARITDRRLIERSAPLGKDGAAVVLRYVVGTVKGHKG